MVARYRHRSSATVGAVPSAANLLDGEIGVNTADGRAFIKTPGGVKTLPNTDDVLGARQQWLLTSDSQPRNEPTPTSAVEIAKWRQVCTDIGARHPNLSAVYFEGDLLDRPDLPLSNPAYYQYSHWVEDIVKTGVPLERVYTIGGNHDMSMAAPYNSDEYLRYFKKLNYASYNGNFLNIHLSDMKQESDMSGSLDQAAMDWFKRMVRSHQGTHNIILHIHHPIANTTAGSEQPGPVTWIQERSAEFIDFMTNDPLGKIDLVLHGHCDQGLPGQPGGDNGGSTSMGVANQVQAYGAWHINVGLHLSSYIEPTLNPGGLPMSYCTADAVEGASSLVVRRWNVETGTEVIGKRVNVPLRHLIRIAGGERYDTRSEKLDRQVRGQWTPSVSFDVLGTFNPTYTLRMGEYVRDGDLVHFNVRLLGKANSYTGAGGLLRVLLPLPAKETFYSAAAIGARAGLKGSSAAYNSLSAYVAHNGLATPTGIYFREINFDTGAEQVMGPDSLAPNADFYLVLTGTYFLPERYDSY